MIPGSGLSLRQVGRLVRVRVEAGWIWGRLRKGFGALTGAIPP